MGKITNFENVVKDYIGPKKRVVDYSVTNLIAPGENYLSEIVKIDVTLENNESGVKEDLNVVAKLVTDDPMMGSTAHLTQNEVLFYSKIVPSVKRFHEKHGLPYPSFYPEFIGARLNLNGSDEPDRDALLVLENLKIKGYENLDRHVGFDLETAKLVLSDLAIFHAAPLAMKLIEPEIFETEIKPFCAKPPPHMNRPGSPGAPGERPSPPGPPGIGQTYNIFLDIFEEKKYSDVVVKFKKFKERMEDIMKNNPEEFFNRAPVEPFATLMHSDMWLNNTMQLIKDGKLIQNKLVDFQMVKMGSPIQDLIFLLFSSVELSCLKQNLDTLLNHYHQSFASILKKCGCYEPKFSYEELIEEIKLNGPSAIGQCIMMMSTIIFAEKGHAVDIKNSTSKTRDDIPPLAVKKLTYLCVEATKRNWF